MSLNQDARSWYPVHPSPSPSSSSNNVGMEFPYFCPYSMDDYRTLEAVAVAGKGTFRYNICPNQTPNVYSNGYHNCYAYSGYVIYYPTVSVNNDDGSTDVLMENAQNGHRTGGKKKIKGKQIWVPKNESETSISNNTTVMIKNIPRVYRRVAFMEFLDKCCLEQQMEYDFLYLPMNFSVGRNRGYAFVNCTNESVANKMKEFFQGFKWETLENDHPNKISKTAWAKHQGKDELVSYFSKITFNCGDNEYLPVLISPPRNGSNASSVTIIGELKKEDSKDK